MRSLIAAGHPGTGEGRTLVDDASGGLDDRHRHDGSAALAQALTAPPPALPEGQPKGLALIAAMADADAGLDGDVTRAARGVAGLRALGQEGAARAAALQLLVGPLLGATRG